jgi:putative spermidine/putrescine transport system ATP-binding protein
MTAAIEFRDVSRVYGEVRAVDRVSLTVEAGEFFAMLGPSGSGKTTCLRLIAGFETPDSGSVLLNGRDVTDDPPYVRDVNTVFQDYALFPHMSVLENVAYGPRVRGQRKEDWQRRALEMLELVQLGHFAERRPSQLSGGQRQRVSLARALINQPRVLLLDEPLGALDLKLREQMQVELKALQRQLGITFVYVTHDQGEALSMSDRLAVFSHGRIEQIGSPAQIYEHPATAFVAGFVGVSNVCEGPLAQRLSGSPAPFAIRPEKVRFCPRTEQTPAGWVHVDGTIESVVYLGAATRYLVALQGGGIITVLTQNADDRDAGPAAGDPVRLRWMARHQQHLATTAA